MNTPSHLRRFDIALNDDQYQAALQLAQHNEISIDEQVKSLAVLGLLHAVADFLIETTDSDALSQAIAEMGT